MFVNRLPLVIVLGIELSVRTGDGLRSFVGFETQVAHLVFVSLLLVPKAPVAQHQVVMRLQVFRIDRENRLQHVHRIRPRSFRVTRSRGYCARTLRRWSAASS